MNLDHVDAELRPRQPWEAVDLGVALFRRHARVLATTWAATVLPIAVLLWFVWGENFFAFALCLVALKPLFERVPVFVLGRALFCATTSVRDVWRQLPRLWLRHAFLGVLVHRMTSQRGMLAPIVVLEGVSGARLRQRQRLIAQTNGGKAAFVAFAGSLFELVLCVLMHALTFILVPDEFLPHVSFDSVSALRESLGGYEHVVIGYWVLAFSITGVLHACCGFALYIDRRAHLEGWDLEVAFRRLAAALPARATRMARALVALLCCACALAPAAMARTTVDDHVRVERAKATVDEVLAGDDFGHTVTDSRWTWNDREQEPDKKSGEPRTRDTLGADPTSTQSSATRGAATAASAAWTIAEWLVWSLVAIAAATAIVFGVRRYLATRGIRAPAAPALDVMGLDLRPESLPDDIVGAARAAADAGDHARAVSLLYRAALSRLVEHDGLRLDPGDTEGDCVRRAGAIIDHERVDVLRAITVARIRLVYARATVDRAAIEELCIAFARHFERARAA